MGITKFMNPGIVAILPEETVMDDERNPIIFKNEQEAIAYLMDLGFKEAELHAIRFMDEVAYEFRNR